MSDNELPPLPDASAPRSYICTECGYVGEVGPTHVKPNSEACYYLALEIPARFGADQMREYARAVERAAYERAVQECIETAAELRRCADGCTDGRYDWKADGADDCADAIRALGGAA